MTQGLDLNSENEWYGREAFPEEVIQAEIEEEVGE